MSNRLPEKWTEEGKTNRLPDDKVPYVNFNPNNGTVNVNHNDVLNADDNVRFRREVSRIKGASRSFLRIANPAICHFGDFYELFREAEVRSFRYHAEFLFGTDEMFEYLYLYSQSFKCLKLYLS